MILFLVLAIILGIFAVIGFILYFTKNSEGCLKASIGFVLIAVACLLTYFYIAPDERTPTSSSTITTTAPETTTGITTVEIDGVTYAVMDDKLYEIIEDKKEKQNYE